MSDVLIIWFAGYVLAYFPLIYIFREEVFNGPFREFLISILVVTLLCVCWPLVGAFIVFGSGRDHD